MQTKYRMENPFENDIVACIPVLRQGGVILYPTDTIWGLGCNALDEKGIEKIVTIKKRDESKKFVLLMTDTRQLMQFIADPFPGLDELLQQFSTPTTVIYPNAINLPAALTADDGSIAVRVTRDPFCRSLIKRLRAPLVSTSANFSGEEAPKSFADINADIINLVDYTVKWRQEEQAENAPSSILKLYADGTFTKIR